MAVEITAIENNERPGPFREKCEKAAVRGPPPFSFVATSRRDGIERKT
jgi:hypothetical protein